MMPSPGDGFVIIEETTTGRPSGDNSLFLRLRQFLDEPFHYFSLLKYRG